MIRAATLWGEGVRSCGTFVVRGRGRGRGRGFAYELLYDDFVDLSGQSSELPSDTPRR